MSPATDLFFRERESRQRSRTDKQQQQQQGEQVAPPTRAKREKKEREEERGFSLKSGPSDHRVEALARPFLLSRKRGFLSLSPCPRIQMKNRKEEGRGKKSQPATRPQDKESCSSSLDSALHRAVRSLFGEKKKTAKQQSFERLLQGQPPAWSCFGLPSEGGRCLYTTEASQAVAREKSRWIVKTPWTS